MKIAILILFTEDWQPIADIVLPNAQKYADKHGYTLETVKYNTQFSGFEKLKLIKVLFNEYDIVWSLDMDTLITNHTIKIEDFLKKGKDFYICKDHGGINAGSFIIRKSFWGNYFIGQSLHFKGQPFIYCEQDAFNISINSVPQEPIAILSHPSINSYLYENYPELPPQTHSQGQWENGDFLLHLPALGIQKRIDILNEIKQHIIYE